MMQNKNIIIFTFLTALLLDCSQLQAADICVTNSTEFQAALDTASDNGQDDHIKLERGHYPIINGFPFRYVPPGGEEYELKITGGYSEFLSNPCGFLDPNTSAFETELDGLSLHQILNIYPIGTADIEISALYFVNGDTTIADPFTRGAGLGILGSGHIGDILIENNAFVDNSAKYGSALSVSGGNKITVRNNLVIANSAELGAAIELVNSEQRGIYFTNNTVINNSTDGTGTFTAAVYIGMSGTSQGFIANNILWNNEHQDLSFLFLTNTYLYNNDIGVYSGGVPIDESGNFSAEPEFEPALAGGLSFTPAYNSNLHNQGIEPPIIVPIPTPFESDWDLGNNDTLGRERVINGRVDIGSFETPPETPIFIDGFEG